MKVKWISYLDIRCLANRRLCLDVLSTSTGGLGGSRGVQDGTLSNKAHAVASVSLPQWAYIIFIRLYTYPLPLFGLMYTINGVELQIVISLVIGMIWVKSFGILAKLLQYYIILEFYRNRFIGRTLWVVGVITLRNQWKKVIII